ncbi:50S ribosomal protein L10 [Candidatus Pacearchaeota archaeon]|nr:50S ribosomal protein L10 [Candidatus Pacearchaeota archaeon]
MATAQRTKDIPAYKVELVSALAKEIKQAKTVLLASTSKLPSSQFHAIKKKLRAHAAVRVARKSAVVRAIQAVSKAGLQPLADHVQSDVALFFSQEDAFALSGLLSDNKSPTKAKAGDIAPIDIQVEPGPTDMVPGPAISELSGVGLKVAVEGGKLAIKQPHVIVKAGQVIKDNVASVMGKLNILPMSVGFEPLAAYDSVADKVYVGIKIDKKAFMEAFRTDIAKGRGFALGLNYISSDTITPLLHKAALHEKALASKLSSTKEGA